LNASNSITCPQFTNTLTSVPPPQKRKKKKKTKHCKTTQTQTKTNQDLPNTEKSFDIEEHFFFKKLY